MTKILLFFLYLFFAPSHSTLTLAESIDNSIANTEKIQFDLSLISSEGLIGPPDGVAIVEL